MRTAGYVMQLAGCLLALGAIVLDYTGKGNASFCMLQAVFTYMVGTNIATDG